jgi:ribosomal protein L21E
MRHVLRIVLPLAIVAVLIVVGVGTVMAQMPSPKLVGVKGIISAVNDTATPTVSITPKEGSPVVLNVTSSTIITKAGIGKATVDDLATGDRAVAIYDKDTMIARKISVSQPLKRHHAFVGNITSMSDNSFVVTTRNGTATITVNSQTKYEVPGLNNATLEDFNVGDRVAVLAVEITTDSIVENLALHVNLIPGKPLYIHRVGTIESYQAGANITLKDRKGESSTFIVTGDTKIIFKKGATDTEPRVGDRATVIARRDPATDQFTARAIIVFGSKES